MTDVELHNLIVTDDEVIPTENALDRTFISSQNSLSKQNNKKVLNVLVVVQLVGVIGHRAIQIVLVYTHTHTHIVQYRLCWYIYI